MAVKANTDMFRIKHNDLEYDYIYMKKKSKSAEKEEGILHQT